MSDMKTPWTRDGCAIRDADGETVGLFMGNGGYMAAARWPKAEHVLHCVNSHDALDARVRELEAGVESISQKATDAFTSAATRIAELEGFVESLRNRLSAKGAGFPVRGPRKK